MSQVNNRSDLVDMIRIFFLFIILKYLITTQNVIDIKKLIQNKFVTWYISVSIYILNIVFYKLLTYQHNLLNINFHKYCTHFLQHGVLYNYSTTDVHNTTYLDKLNL